MRELGLTMGGGGVALETLDFARGRPMSSTSRRVDSGTWSSSSSSSSRGSEGSGEEEEDGWRRSRTRFVQPSSCVSRDVRPFVSPMPIVKVRFAPSRSINFSTLTA